MFVTAPAAVAPLALPELTLQEDLAEEGRRRLRGRLKSPRWTLIGRLHFPPGTRLTSIGYDGARMAIS